MFRFEREREIAKGNFCAGKEPIKVWDFNVDDIVISKLVKTALILGIVLDILVNL